MANQIGDTVSKGNYFNVCTDETNKTFETKSFYTDSEDVSFADGENAENKKLEKTIYEIVETLYSLSRQRIGALIILERETKISDIISTGTIIDGDVSRQLLINIFIPN